MEPSSTVSSTPNTLEEGSQVSPDISFVDESRPTSLSEKLEGYEVRLEPEDDPQKLSLLRRWLAVATISFGTLCSGCASSSVGFL